MARRRYAWRASKEVRLEGIEGTSRCLFYRDGVEKDGGWYLPNEYRKEAMRVHEMAVLDILIEVGQGYKAGTSTRVDLAKAMSNMLATTGLREIACVLNFTIAQHEHCTKKDEEEDPPVEGTEDLNNQWIRALKVDIRDLGYLVPSGYQHGMSEEELKETEKLLGRSLHHLRCASEGRLVEIRHETDDPA